MNIYFCQINLLSVECLSAFSIDFVFISMFVTYVPGKDVNTLKGKNLGMQKCFFLLQVDLRSPPQRGFYHKKKMRQESLVINSH